MEQTKLKTGPPANQPAIQDAVQVMQAFSGAYKKRNLYSAHHSVYQDAIRNLKNALDRFMEHYGNMHLQVEREAILYEGEVVYEGAKQTNDLVFILRRDGVLWFEFKKGLEIEEIETFVTLLHEHCVLEEEPEEDIVTALWANRLLSISFEAADLELGLDDDIDIAALPCCPADFETAADEDDEDKQASDTPSACAIEENEPDRLQDGDELFKLAEDDREQLEKMIAEEKKIDGSDHVVDVLLYIIETHCTPQDVGDLLKYMVQAMEEALLKQRFSQLSNVLTRIKRHLDEFRSIEHWSADHLEQFIQTLSSGAFLEHLLKVSPDIDLAPQENLNALKRFLFLLDAESIATLAPMTLRNQSHKLHKVLVEAIVHMARHNFQPLEKMILSTDKDLVVRIIFILKYFNDSHSRQILVELLADESQTIRKQALKTLIARKDKTLEDLFALIDDPDSDIRKLLLRHLGRERNDQVETFLLNYLNTARTSDPEHYLAVCKTLGKCASDRSLHYLKKLLFKWPKLGILRSGCNIRNRAALCALKELNTKNAIDLIDRAEQGFIKNFLRSA